MNQRNELIHHFLRAQGWGGAARGRLAGDASFRHYDRLEQNGKRVVLMDAPPPQEDVRPFVALAEHLFALGYSVPRILASEEENGFLLLEDLGDNTYTRLIARGHDEAQLYRLAIDVLVDLHGKPGAVPGHVPAYDDNRLLIEALLLPDWFHPAVSDDPLSDADRKAYIAVWKELFPMARKVPGSLVLRDFHVDNLMYLDDREGVRACGLLDFQDAVAGPVTYDLMSLMEDARRDIDPALSDEMRQRYLAHFPSIDREDFDISWRVLAAQRHCKVIGIFTRLWKRDGKPIYLCHIPRVWRLLEAAVDHPALAGLQDWLDRLVPAEKRGLAGPSPAPTTPFLP